LVHAAVAAMYLADRHSLAELSRNVVLEEVLPLFSCGFRVPRRNLAETLRALVENAHKKFSRRHRVSRAARVRQAEKIGAPQAGPKILLEVLRKRQPWPTLPD
jgi:hypothetical protein